MALDKVSKLSELQKNFIKEYIKDLSCEKAALRAGYSQKFARERGESLLENPVVVDEVKRLMKTQNARAKVEKSYIIEKLLSIVEFCLAFEEETDKEGNPTGKKKIRDTSAGMKALEILGKQSTGGDSGGEAASPKVSFIKNLDDSKI